MKPVGLVLCYHAIRAGRQLDEPTYRSVVRCNLHHSPGDAAWVAVKRLSRCQLGNLSSCSLNPGITEQPYMICATTSG